MQYFIRMSLKDGILISDENANFKSLSFNLCFGHMFNYYNAQNLHGNNLSMYLATTIVNTQTLIMIPYYVF